jgi:hypothetical protein
MAKKKTSPTFLLCIKNDRYRASLEVRKIYRAIADEAAKNHKLVRVIDESGEDYLYPETYFVPVELPQTAFKALMRAS